MSQDSNLNTSTLLAMLVLVAVAAAEDATISVDMHFDDEKLKQQVKALRDCINIVKDINVTFSYLATPEYRQALKGGKDQKETYKSVNAELEIIRSKMTAANFVKGNVACPKNIVAEMKNTLLRDVAELRNWAPIVTNEDRKHHEEIMRDNFESALGSIYYLADKIAREHPNRKDNLPFKFGTIVEDFKSWDYAERSEESQNQIKDIDKRLYRLHENSIFMGDRIGDSKLQEEIFNARIDVELFRAEVKNWLDAEKDTAAESAKAHNAELVSGFLNILSYKVQLEGDDMLKSISGKVITSSETIPFTIPLTEDAGCLFTFEPRSMLTDDNAGNKELQVDEEASTTLSSLVIAFSYKNNDYIGGPSQDLSIIKTGLWQKNWDIQNPHTFALTNDEGNLYNTPRILKRVTEKKYLASFNRCTISVYANALDLFLQVQLNDNPDYQKSRRLVL